MQVVKTEMKKVQKGVVMMRGMVGALAREHAGRDEAVSRRASRAASSKHAK